MRILGLDYGAHTVGVAISDPTLTITEPLFTITRKRESQLRQTLHRIAGLVEQYQVSLIVLGMPYQLSGAEGERAERTKRFMALLQKRVPCRIMTMDERLTTVEAQEILDENGIRRSEQKRVIDQLAAQLILESYLREHRETVMESMSAASRNIEKKETGWGQE